MKNQMCGTSSKGVVLFVSGMASFPTPFMVSALNVALASIGKEFAFNAVILSWVPMAIQNCPGFLVTRGLLAKPQEAAD
jgi:hypothetical protein